jgi:transglutaminase-like putative cysteine protease
MSKQILISLFFMLQLWLAWMSNEQLVFIVLPLLGWLVANREHAPRRLIDSQRWILSGSFLLLFVIKMSIAPRDARSDAFFDWQVIAYAVAFVSLIAQVWELEQKAEQVRIATRIVPLGALAIDCYFSQANLGQQGFSIATALLALLFPLALLEMLASGKEIKIDLVRLSSTGFLFAFSTVLAMQMNTLYLEIVPRVQNFLESQLGTRTGPVRAIRSYIRHATLSSVALEKTTDAQEMAISVVCKQMPGYMRGSAYESFTGTQWQTASNRQGYRNRNMHTLSPQLTAPLELPTEEKQNCFTFQTDAQAPWITLSIGNDPRRGKMYFLPLEVDVLQSTSRELLLDEHHIIRDGINPKSRYLAAIGPGSRKDILSEAYRESLLTIPQQLQTPVENIRKKTFVTNQSIEEKILAAERYFRANYQYTLDGFQTPHKVDSLTYFLQSRPASHCEYFATAVALLLRSEGIPTRYVTGYMVVTSSWGDSERWIGRNRDAHAWVEAYDAETSQWHIVEATPGVNVPKYLRASHMEQEVAAAQRVTGAELTNETEDWFWTRWFTFRNRAVDQIVTLTAAFVVLGGCLWWLFNRYKNHLPRGTNAHRLSQMRKLLQKVESRLSRHHMTRSPSETLSQFAARLQQATQEKPQFTAFANWLQHYAQVMYSNPDDTTAYEKLAQQLP